MVRSTLTNSPKFTTAKRRLYSCKTRLIRKWFRESLYNRRARAGKQLANAGDLGGFRMEDVAG